MTPCGDMAELAFVLTAGAMVVLPMLIAGIVVIIKVVKERNQP